jgi:hypothetical protein
LGGPDGLKYYKDALGYVHCRGNITRGVAVGALTANELCFTFPPGYRPDVPTGMNNPRFPIATGATLATEVWAFCIVAKTGAVTLAPNGIAGTSDKIVSFTMVSFRAHVDGSGS